MGTESNLTPRNALDDGQKLRLWDWLRANKLLIEQKRWTLRKITDAAAHHFDFEVTKGNVETACKIVGVAWTRDDRGAAPGALAKLREVVKFQEEQIKLLEQAAKTQQAQVLALEARLAHLEKSLGVEGDPIVIRHPSAVQNSQFHRVGFAK